MRNTTSSRCKGIPAQRLSGVLSVEGTLYTHQMRSGGLGRRAANRETSRVPPTSTRSNGRTAHSSRRTNHSSCRRSISVKQSRTITHVTIAIFPKRRSTTTKKRAEDNKSTLNDKKENVQEEDERPGRALMYTGRRRETKQKAGVLFLFRAIDPE